MDVFGHVILYEIFHAMAMHAGIYMHAQMPCKCTC